MFTFCQTYWSLWLDISFSNDLFLSTYVFIIEVGSGISSALQEKEIESSLEDTEVLI